MDIKMMTGTTLMLFAMMIMERIQLNHSMPSIGVSGTDIWDIGENATPSHVRPIRLYSKQGHYVAITADGDVTATRNESSEDGKINTILLVQNILSYSTKLIFMMLGL